MHLDPRVRRTSSRVLASIVGVAAAVCIAAPPGGAAAPAPLAASTMRTDFNGDGRDELVIAAPGEDVRSVVDAGALHVLNGSSSGVVTTGNRMFVEGDTLSGTAQRGDFFGVEYTSGDYNADGYVDLAVPAPFQSVSGVARAGLVHVIPGSATGLARSGEVTIDQTTPGVPTDPRVGEAFGLGSASGDFNGDGYDDLAVGTPGELVFGRPDSGAVFVFFGSADGLVLASGVQMLTQGSIGADRSDKGDVFGDQLAAGDTNGDGIDDLAITAAGEDWGSFNAYLNVGLVTVVLGTPTGLTGGFVNIGEMVEELKDKVETDDMFGSAVAMGDINGDGFDEVIVGALEGRRDRGTGLEAGKFWVVGGSPTGPTFTNVQKMSQDTPGVADKSELGDRFGSYALATGDVNGDGFADLAVSCEGEDRRRGAAYLFYGSADGLRGSASQRFTADNDGAGSTREIAEFYGTSLALRDYDGDGDDDLSIGVLGDVIRGVHAGSVVVLPSDGVLLSPVGVRLFAQGRNGLLGKAEDDDLFGAM